MQVRRHLCILGVFLLAGCAAGDPAPGTSREAAPGSDRDAHGCIGSAGYRWCEATQQCERPWELAQARGFEQTAEAFEAFCAVQPQ